VPSRRWLVIIVTHLAFVLEASAQFRPLPPSPPVEGRGPGWRKGRLVGAPHLHVYYGPPPGLVFGAPGFAPYGVVESRVHVQIIVPAPPPVLVPRFFEPALDLSGVDLDAGPPPWAKDFGPRRGVPAVAPKEEVAKRVEPAREQELPEPRKQEMPPREPLLGEPFQPGLTPGEQCMQLTALGVAAFLDQEYGLAAQRFHQALDADPAAARPHFLLGHAYLALGKFGEAVQMIGLGLAKDPAWPRSDFKPRLVLYRNEPADWLRHLALLEETQARHPQQARYLFLLAYARWFDDDRTAALRLFREVRPLVADPALVDLFLKATP